MKLLLSLAALLIVASIAVLAGFDGKRATGQEEYFLDSYKCYRAVGFGFEPTNVTLDDQFESKAATVTRVRSFCNLLLSKGVDGNAGGGGNEVEARDYACYELEQGNGGHSEVQVEVDPDNVFFGTEDLFVREAEELCVRTEKGGGQTTLGGPAGPGGIIPQALKCYNVRRVNFGFTFTRIDLEDQFGFSHAIALWPVTLCVPQDSFGIEKQIDSVGAAGSNFDGMSLLCYRLFDFSFGFEHLTVDNALGYGQSLLTLWADKLCIESEKFEDD